MSQPTTLRIAPQSPNKLARERQSSRRGIRKYFRHPQIKIKGDATTTKLMTVQGISLTPGLGEKPVSHSPHGQQMSRIAGIVFDIATQPYDEIIDRARVSILM